MLQISNYKVLKSLLRNEYDIKLVSLILWVSHRFDKFCMTSGFRLGPGVHGTSPCRAIDIRSHYYDDPEDICKEINSHWIYDPERPSKPCALYHDIGYGPHIHLQVHENTKELKV